jgi:membrane associated rhomboid family serine protease
MGINERDYTWDEERAGIYGSGAAPTKRRFGRMNRWSANTWLIAVNILVFVGQMLLPAVRIPAARGGGARDILTELGHFSTYEVTWAGGLEFWRFITFQFLHANIMHIGFNMLGLVVFGSLLEEYLGRKKYLAFYLTCGIFGGMLFLILNAVGLYVSPNFQKALPLVLTSSPYSPLVGASAGVFGVIMACAYIAPDEMVQIPLPPVAVRMKVLAYVYVGIAFANLLIGGRNQGGDAAHIGGAIAGFFLIRHSHLLRDFFDVWGDSRRIKRAARKGVKLRLATYDAGQPSSRSRGGSSQQSDTADQIEGLDQEEVDRILAKHKQYGPQSLSEDELETLRTATELLRAADKSKP